MDKFIAGFGRFWGYVSAFLLGCVVALVYAMRYAGAKVTGDYVGSKDTRVDKIIQRRTTDSVIDVVAAITHDARAQGGAATRKQRRRERREKRREKDGATEEAGDG